MVLGFFGLMEVVFGEIFNDSYVKPPPPSISTVWSLVTGTYHKSSAIAKVYNDGIEFSQKTILNRIQNQNIITIGKDEINNNRLINGLIDDVRIYNRALSAAEVQALYNMGQ